MTEKKYLPRERIREIAEAATEGFELPTLPDVREIAWAFPISYGGWTAEHQGEILNGQECDAWGALRLLRNYGLTLEHSKEGKFVKFMGQVSPPSHILFGDSIFDSSHLHFPYAGRIDKKSKFDVGHTPEPIRGLKEKLSESIYWDNIPEELCRQVVQCDGLMHGYDRKAEQKIAKPFTDEEALTNYLTSLKETLGASAQYLASLQDLKDQINGRLVQVTGDQIESGDYIQVVSWTDNRGPYIHQGTSRGVAEGRLGLDLWRGFHQSSNLEDWISQANPLADKVSPIWRYEAAERRQE